MTTVVMEEPDTRTSAGPRRGATRVVIVAAVLVAAASAVSIVMDRLEGAVLFPLHTVRIDGDLGNVQEADLRHAIQEHLHGGLLGVDVTAVRRAVEALPWVAAAAVRRVWPDALRVTVTEQRAIARWGEDGLLNEGGQVFRPGKRPSGLPVLSGPPGTAERVLTRFREVRRRLRNIGLEVTGLHLDARRSWTADLEDGAVIRFGQDDGEDRLERFVTAWPSIAGSHGGQLESADLRYPNGFAVDWRESATGTAEQRRKD